MEKVTRRRAKAAQEQMAAQVEAAQAYGEQVALALANQQVEVGAADAIVEEVSVAPAVLAAVPAAGSVEDTPVKR